MGLGRRCSCSRLVSYQVSLCGVIPGLRFHIHNVFHRSDFYFSFFLFFYNCIVPFGITPMGILSCPPQGKPAATESCYPTYGVCWVFQCFHNPPNSDTDMGIFNMRTDVNACDCTRGCTDTIRESARESWHWGENPLPHWGFKPASAACQSVALPTELHHPPSTTISQTSEDLITVE